MCFKYLVMRLILNVFSVVCIVLIVGCSASKVTSEEQNIALEKLLEEKSFEIVSQWAYPQSSFAMNSISSAGLLPLGSTAGMIDLIGNSNYLRFKGDTIKAYLPYFGERQMGARLSGNNTGIEFDGLPKDYSIKKGKKNSYKIRFEISDKNSNTETYNVLVIVHQNLNSSININSSQRFSIRYKGQVSSYLNPEVAKSN